MNYFFKTLKNNLSPLKIYPEKQITLSKTHLNMTITVKTQNPYGKLINKLTQINS